MKLQSLSTTITYSYLRWRVYYVKGIIFNNYHFSTWLDLTPEEEHSYMIGSNFYFNSGFYKKQWPCDGGLPIQSYHAEKHWVTAWLRQPFIFLILIRLATGISGNLMVKTNLIVQNSSAVVMYVNAIHKGGA